MMNIKLHYKKGKIIISLLLLPLTFACKNDTPLNVEKSNIPTTAYVEFVFPDTIYLNKSYNGELKYKGILDTITTSFEDETKKRYISFYMRKTEEISYEMKELYSFKLDTFGAIDNKTIPFYDVKFTKVGTYYIDGLINDHVTIEILSEQKKPTDKARYIENIVRATHKVVVIDKR